jgi:hypothetical protein
MNTVCILADIMIFEELNNSAALSFENSIKEREKNKNGIFYLRCHLSLLRVGIQQNTVKVV